MPNPQSSMLPTPQYIHSLSVPGADEPAHTHPLRIVGIYSDLPAHAVAMTLLHRLAAGCSGQTKVSSVWFSFERLQHQTEREIAAARAARADMLWYSGYGDERPPLSARLLIESWSRSAGSSERAVVALFQTPADATTGGAAAEEILRDLVRRSRRPLFVHRVQRGQAVTELARSETPEVAARFAC